MNRWTEILGEEAAARAAAEYAAQQAAWAAEWAAGPQYGEEWEEWWEEEGGWEYTAYDKRAESGEKAHIEPAVLVQPLGESASEAGGKAGAVVRLCNDAEHETGKTEPCTRFAWFGSGAVHWVTKHVIKPVEHVWKTVGRYVSRGASEAWKASGASGKAIWEVGKAGFEDWANSGVE